MNFNVKLPDFRDRIEWAGRGGSGARRSLSLSPASAVVILKPKAARDFPIERARPAKEVPSEWLGVSGPRSGTRRRVNESKERMEGDVPKALALM